MKKNDNIICAISSTIVRKHNETGDFLYSDYRVFFEKHGIELVPLSNFSGNNEEFLKDLKVSGIILSGGNSIGEEPCRDNAEKLILDIAVERSIPVFGICRGMQFINKYFSNNKPLNIKGSIKHSYNHVAERHVITIVDKDLVNTFGKDKITVNSYHNQGYISDNISQSIHVTALSGDGIVEALRHKELPILGVQWHPERPGQEESINDAIINLFKDIMSVYNYGESE